MVDLIIDKIKLQKVIEEHRFDPSKFHNVSKENFCSLLESDEMCMHMFGKERPVIDWVPYRPIKSNVEYMMQETTPVIGSSLDSVDKSLLTFSQNFQILIGTMYFIEVYGNIDELTSHLLSHLHQALNTKTENIIVRMFHDKDIKDDDKKTYEWPEISTHS